jgi:hypothetical protein
MTVSPLARPQRFESLLIVRLGAMGDIIHTLPAATALRQAFPHATLGWLVEERWAELLCTLRYPRSGPRSPQRPLVDRVHSVNTAEWRRALFSFNTWQQIATGLSQLRGIRYDAVIDFQGAVRSALLGRWSGSPILYGDAQPRENAASMFYTRKVLTTCNGRHVVQQALALAVAVISSGTATSAAPTPAAELPAEFPVDPDAERKIRELTARLRKSLRNMDSRPSSTTGLEKKLWPPRSKPSATELREKSPAQFPNSSPSPAAPACSSAAIPGPCIWRQL